MKMAEREENQVIAMWPEDFEDLSEERTTPSAFITDVAAITPEDYEKFFNKIRKTPLLEDQLKQKVPKEYHL